MSCTRTNSIEYYKGGLPLDTMSGMKKNNYCNPTFDLWPPLKHVPKGLMALFQYSSQPNHYASRCSLSHVSRINRFVEISSAAMTYCENSVLRYRHFSLETLFFRILYILEMQLYFYYDLEMKLLNYHKYGENQRSISQLLFEILIFLVKNVKYRSLRKQ